MHGSNLIKKRNEKMNLLELRKKSLVVLLVSFVALGMAACSSTGDSSSDDSASGGSSGGNSACEDVCYSDEVPDFQLDECIMSCGAAD
jgi:hypothetical protein